MTLEQLLNWEDRQELRYKFDGFQPITRTGGTRAHVLRMPEIDTEVPLDEFYEGVELPPPSTEDRRPEEDHQESP